MSQLIELKELQNAFQNRLKTFSLVNIGHSDINHFMIDAFNYFQQQINLILTDESIIKVGACFSAVFEKTNVLPDIEVKEKQTVYIQTRTLIVDFETDLWDFFNEYISVYVMSKIDDFELNGSGFTLSEVKDLVIQVSHYEPFKGSSYIELPKFLKSKRAIINVQNKDNACFKYAILSALYPVANHAERVYNYKPYLNSLDFSGIDFPVEVKQIAKFEQQNSTISVNVYVFDQKDKKIRSLRLTKNVKSNHIHLLLLTEDSFEDDSNQHKKHYCWIKNLSALLSQQISSDHKHKHFCDRCLNHFTCLEKLNSHQIICFDQNDCQIEMPALGENIIKFTNYSKQMRVPFIIYADVESILKKPEDNFCKSDSTVAYQQHEVYSIGYYFKCCFDESNSYYKSNRGMSCVDWFMSELYRIATDVENIIDNKMPMNLSNEEELSFRTADRCHICGKKYTENDAGVRDHCHLTGKYRGSAHSSCNLQYKVPRFIPVVFHNLSNYDAHFLIEKLASTFSGDISVIPLNDQVYISFTKTVKSSKTKDYTQFIKYRFIDSYRFMSSSLDYLSSLLPSDKKNNLHAEFVNLDNEQTELVERKGVLCYDYIDSWQKLDETALPAKHEFYSKLNESHITDEEYDFALKIWQKFNIKTIGMYSDLYLKTDILLLADVFENFRETCYSIYELDPAHYYTTPGLSFDSMLKYTKVEIELFTDVDMLLFIERGIRGGIVSCVKRYAKANNQFLPNFDADMEKKFLIFLDCNNLYGSSMMQHLPISDFQWCNEEFTSEKILNISDDAATAYIFEVDISYPEFLHNKHKDYPLLAEKMTVPGTKNSKKLLLTLYDKKNYVIHYKMLKFVLQQGLIITKIHKVLQFTQSQWLKPYVELNTELRTKACNDFEKNFYKLMVNGNYGKSIENLRNRIQMYLKTYWEGRYGASKLIAKPNFKKFTIFNENLVAIQLNKTNILMNKHIVVGMAILDISKVLMFDFYYNFLKHEYGDNVELAYTDTDSYLLQIKTDSFYDDMKRNLHLFDTSDYPETNIFNMPRVNKKQPGLFKDELNGEIISEFVGLRSKMYCVKSLGVEKKKKAKGVKKYVLKKDITFDDYVNCIKNSCVIVKNQNSFRSKMHTVYSVQQQKVALSPFDDKRFILSNNIDTLPWGHFDIPK